MVNLSGNLPPLPTPFNEDGSVAHDKFAANIAKWNSVPFQGYVVLGSTGEYVSVSVDEHVEIVKTARKAVPRTKVLVVGTGCQGTKNTAELCKKVAAAGADAAMVVTPHYFKAQMTNEALKAHYKEVADKSPIPVVIYNIPMCTSIDISVEVVAELAAHPNIIGIKDSGGNIVKIAQLVTESQKVDPKFQVLVGSSNIMLPGLMLGAVGVICGMANAIGQPVCDLYELIKAGKYEEAAKLERRLIPAERAMTAVHFIAGIKAAIGWFGFYGGPTRLPLLPLTPKESQELKKSFAKTGYLNI